MKIFKSKIFWLVVSINIALIAIWIVLSTLTWKQIVVSSLIKDIDQPKKIPTSQIKNFFKLSENEIAMIDRAVIDSDNVNVFIDQLLELAQVAGVEADINKAQAGTNSLEINIIARGKFSNSIHFLSLVEKMPHRLVVTKESLYLPEVNSGDTFKVKSEKISRLWSSEINFKILSYHK
jgi:hypothetical protein